MHYLAVDTINQDLVTVFSGDPSHERSSPSKPRGQKGCKLEQAFHACEKNGS